MPCDCLRSRRSVIPRLVALAGLLAIAHPTTVQAQQNDMPSDAQSAEIRAVPLTMDLSRRAYGVTADMMSLVKADPELQKAFLATMGAGLDATVRTLTGQPKIAALVRAARSKSVREYEIANMAFVTAYAVGNADPGEQLDPQHLTSPAQIAFVRAHKAELTKLMANMPLLVPHTTALD